MSEDDNYVDLENLTPENRHELSKISLDIRREYIELLDSIGEYNNFSLNWLLSSVASRDIYLSPLYERCCKIAFILKKNRGKKNNFETLDKTFINVLRIYIRKKSISTEVRCKVDMVQAIKNFIPPIRQFFNISLELVRRMMSRKVPMKFEKGIVLMNIFVTPKGLESEIKGEKKCYQHYYGEFEQYLTDNENKNIVFYPVFYGFKNQSDGIKLLRQSKVNYLVPDDYLSIIDYVWIMFRSVMFLTIKIPNSSFRGVEITKLLYNEIHQKSFSWNCISALLNYRVSMKLAKSNIKFKKLIVWSENQVTDRGLTLGFQTYFPKVPIMAYKGYPISEQYLFHNIPSESEIDNKVHSKNIGIIGKGYYDSIMSYSSNINVSVVPALRYEYVFNDRGNENISEQEKVIFIALPMDYDESIAIIEIFVDFLSNYSVVLKVHPATIDVIKNRILEKYRAYNFNWADENLFAYLSDAFVFVTNNSSAAMVALADGVPVIIVNTKASIAQIPVPTNISMDLYKICYTKTEVKLALTFFKKQWKKGVNMFSKSGSEVKINYFEQISRKNILNMLGLS